MWKVGDKLRHRFNAGAGPGVVTLVEGRSIVVHFPATEATLRFAGDSEAIVPYEMAPGTTARLDVGALTRLQQSVAADPRRNETAGLERGPATAPLEPGTARRDRGREEGSRG